MNSLFFLQFALAAALLSAVAAGWWLLAKHRSRRLGRACASARVQGTCGDHMEVRLTFENGRLTETRQWVNGCAWSHLCLSAAADCARGKTPMEMLAMEQGEITRRVSGLPDDHNHCAELAVRTVHEAVENFYRDRPEWLPGDPPD